jgi:hypothetical protein
MVGQQLRVLILLIVGQVDGVVASPLSAVREIPPNQDNCDNEQGDAGDDGSDQWRVDLLHRSFVTRNLGLVETFARAALEEDALVAIDARDQLVHSRLGEAASTVLSALDRLELGGVLDCQQEVANVDGAVLAAQHAARHTGAVHMFAAVPCDVAVLLGGPVGVARVESAVEGFTLIDPTCAQLLAGPCRICRRPYTGSCIPRSRRCRRRCLVASSL